MENLACIGIGLLSVFVFQKFIWRMQDMMVGILCVAADQHLQEVVEALAHYR